MVLSLKGGSACMMLRGWHTLSGVTGIASTLRTHSSPVARILRLNFIVTQVSGLRWYDG